MRVDLVKVYNSNNLSGIKSQIIEILSSLETLNRKFVLIFYFISSSILAECRILKFIMERLFCIA